MKALTVRQPWAQLIVEGHKDVENRTWPTRYRGPLIIHAGAQWEPDGANTAAAALDDPSGVLQRAHARLGMVVGVVEVIGCHADDDDINPYHHLYEPCSEWAMEDHHHWTLEHAVALDEPLLATGALGLWTPPQRVLDAVREVLGRD